MCEFFSDLKSNKPLCRVGLKSFAPNHNPVIPIEIHCIKCVMSDQTTMKIAELVNVDCQENKLGPLSCVRV